MGWDEAGLHEKDAIGGIARKGRWKSGVGGVGLGEFRWVGVLGGEGLWREEEGEGEGGVMIGKR